MTTETIEDHQPSAEEILGNLVTELTPANTRTAAIMALLCAERGPLVESLGMQRDNCILSTRVVLEVARYFGLPGGRPVMVDCAAFNAAGFAQYQAWHEADPATREPSPRIDDPGWSVVVSGDGHDNMRPRDGAEGGRWNGHLIAMVNGFFVDWSLDQFSRPAKDMPFTAMVFPIQPWWATDGVNVFRRADGCAVIYRRMEGPKVYTGAPDWRHWKEWHRDVVAALITKIKESLA